MDSVGEYEYSTKDLIGHGAFAVVFKGRHKTNHEEIVAIKSITKKNLAKSQNLQGKEIRILKELTELHHENVVALLDYKETTHHVYLVMEYCNGGDLADYLHAKGTLSEDTIHLFLRQIAGAMGALYCKGIVHRDLKPQNILLCHSGKPNPSPGDIMLKIADFGFARFLQNGVMAATLCGSPMYMAPEVIMSLQYDAKADLWSIGTIVFQCLTGKAPFQAQTPQALKHFYETNTELMPRIPNGTSPELTDLLLQLLKRNSKDRMDFDDFFNHSFLKPVTKLSSPVPVPTRLALSPDYICVSHTSPEGSGSSGNRPPSPDRLCKRLEREVIELPQESRNSSKERSFPSSPEDQGFVIVPNSLPEDLNFDSESRGYLKRLGETNSPPIKVHTGTSSHHKFCNPHGLRYPGLSFSPPILGRSTEMPILPLCSSNDIASAAVLAYPISEPIPVPSQKEAYAVIQRSLQDSGSSASGKSSNSKEAHSCSSANSSLSSKTQAPLIHCISSPCGSANSQFCDSDKINADLTSLLPPTVQFSIGIPQPVTRRRRRSYSGGTPNVSPHRRSGCCVLSNKSLSPVIDSPIKDHLQTSTQAVHFYLDTQKELESFKNINTMSCPLRMALGNNAKLLPDVTSTDFWLASNSSPEAAALIPYHSPHFCWNNASPDSASSPCRVRRSSTCVLNETSHTLDRPVMFIAPELPEETLMDKEHNETLAKLNFILALVECILDLAKLKSSPISTITDSSTRKEPHEKISVVTEGYRRAEQLVLYMRALQLLSSSLQLSRQEVQAGHLQPSATVKNVLRTMKDHYHHCLDMCKSLNAAGILQSSGVDPASSKITADRLIYNYAIEMCQSAALEELFGNSKECFQHYQTAQILLHSLGQLISNEEDKKLLSKYTCAVEKRLYVLHSQGYVYAYDTA